MSAEWAATPAQPKRAGKACAAGSNATRKARKAPETARRSELIVAKVRCFIASYLRQTTPEGNTELQALFVFY